MRKVGGYSREFAKWVCVYSAFFFFFCLLDLLLFKECYWHGGSFFFSYAKDFRGIAGFVLLDTFPFLGLLWDSKEPLR